MQNDASKSERPVKKLRADGDIQPMENSHLQSPNANDSAKATDGENLSFCIDLTASDDCVLLPQSPPLAGRLIDLPASSPEAQEPCRTEDDCVRSRPQQLCSFSCTASPPASPTLQTDVDCNSHCQSMNGICDVSSLKAQHRSAAVTVDTNGCGDGITDEIANECRDNIVQTNGLSSPDLQVAGVP